MKKHLFAFLETMIIVAVMTIVAKLFGGTTQTIILSLLIFNLYTIKLQQSN